MTACGDGTKRQQWIERLAEVVAVAAEPALTAWMADAACRGVGAAEFFGPGASGWRWCRRCAVAECCFWWAILTESETGYRFGIWGGATPAVRAKVAGVVGTAWARDRLADALAQWTSPAPGRERRAG
jgi:hypothetical protein